MDSSQSDIAAANEAAWQQYYAAQAQQQPQQQNWNTQCSGTQWQQPEQQQQSLYPPGGQQAAWPDLHGQQQQQWADAAQQHQSAAIATPVAAQQSEALGDASQYQFNSTNQSILVEDSTWALARRIQPAEPPLPPPAPDGGELSEAPPLPPLPPSDDLPQFPDDSSPPPPPPLPAIETAHLSTVPPAQGMLTEQAAFDTQATSIAAASELQSHNQWLPGQPGTWQQPLEQQSNGAHLTGSQQEWTENKVAEWHQHNQQQQYWQQQQQQGPAQWHQGAMQWQQLPQEYWQQQQQWQGYVSPHPQGQLLGHPHIGYLPDAGWASAANAHVSAVQPGSSGVIPSASEPYSGLQGGPKEGPITGVSSPPLVSAASLFSAPGRAQRPTRIVVLLRGPPGSGKSTAARKIREAEVAAGGEAPRTHTLDDYFFTDVEKEVDDEKRKGKKKKITVVEYEYDAEMEEVYEASLVKSFARTVREGKSRVVVVDAPLLRAATVHDLWRVAQGASYEVFVADTLESDPKVCYARNVHGRTSDDVHKAAAALEPAPAAFLRLDLSPLFNGATAAAAANSPYEDNSAAMDVEFSYASTSSPAPLPHANGNSDGSGSDTGGNGSTPPRIATKSRWADPDDDDGAEEEASHPALKKQRTFQAPSAADATVALPDDVSSSKTGSTDPAGSSTAKNAHLAKKLRGILTAGGSNGSNQRVRWPDQQAESATQAVDAAFVVGGASKEQLETVWVLDGLGPPAGDKQYALRGGRASFEDMVKGDHVGEKQAFQRHRLDKGHRH